MKNYKETLYWSAQIAFWSLLNAFVFVRYWTVSRHGNLIFWQESISFTVYALIGIFCTHEIKKYLGKNVFSDKTKTSPVLHTIGIVVFYIITSSILALLYTKLCNSVIYPLLDINIPEKESIDHRFNFLVENIIILLSWVACYIPIKVMLELNRSNKERLILKANLKESQLNTLRGQINPHFIFNSLNNIRGLILEDAHKSREMITRLSDMLRYSLTKNDFDAIALQDELEMVDNYIAISKIQMEDRLQFEKNISINTKEILIPPMIIQMLIENATKHGIANIKNGGVISLNIKQEANNLLIEVVNPGKLASDSNSIQLGIKNIKERLALLYKENASFNLDEINNQVIATIQIPLS
ncbi:MAG: histidine kinase [Kordia sp.]|nr:MAG: histidine kinase [Kordia sp.]